MIVEDVPALRQSSKQKYKEAVRARLIVAARKIVGLKGFAKLTIVNVADEAGVATGSVYKHFDSKSTLCIEVYTQAARKEYEMLRRVLLGPGLASAKLCRCIEVMATRVQSNPVFAYALGVESVDPAIADERAACVDAIVGLFEELIEEGIRTGEFETQLSTISATAVVGVIKESLLGTRSFPILQSNASSQLIAAVQGFCLGAVMHPK